MKNIVSKIKKVTELSNDLVSKMFQLYSCYYAGTSEDIFQSDLKNKDWVFLLYNAENQLQGFSTLAMFDTEFNGTTINILYSGDTIVERKYWGQHELAIAWLRFAGQIKADYPSIPLYWLLIVKGHRTYRYLSAFSRNYYPAPNQCVPQKMQDLMDKIAGEQFGSAYDCSTGIVRFVEPRGYLTDTLAEVPETVKNRPEVKYFLERNPFCNKGDELVCLCELAEENFKPFSKRIFMSGYLDKQKIVV